MKQLVINRPFVDQKVRELAGKNYTAAQIGCYLMDNYYIRARTRLCRIYPFLKQTSEEARKLKISCGRLSTHVDKNRHDYRAQRALTQRIFKQYKIRKLAERNGH